MNTFKSEDANRVAIVVVGYNRQESINRLLGSLLSASYNKEAVPLVISIDCSGDTDLYSFVNNFKWPYGNKYVIIQKVRLGLKEHIYRCGDLTEYFRGIILLEDDIFASPYFYSYAIQALDRYENEKRIAQIALYRNEIVGQVGLPFDPLPSSSDVFLMQAVSTWGECWSSSMWKDFRQWLESFDEEMIKDIDMPDSYKRWTKAWSKYYNAYIISTNKYVVYPYYSLTTNFSEAGEHASMANSKVQVVIQQSDKKYVFESFENLVKYDIYRNNESVFSWLNLSREDLMLDIYGYHNSLSTCNYCLSSRNLPLKVIRSFGLKLRPVELNVKENVTGSGLFLYSINNKDLKINTYKISNEFIYYYLCRFDSRPIIKYVTYQIKRRLLRLLIKNSFSHNKNSKI